MDEKDRVIEEIAGHYRKIIELIGENPDREGLVKTPLRAAKALYFATQGYRQDPDEVMKSAIFEYAGSQMIIVKDIEFYSFCEHHILPFFGKVSIGYLPNGNMIGLSKLARVVNVFARRLQVQERFTSELADVLMEKLEPDGVIVRAEARHLCMAMRGVQKQDSVTVTTATRGVLETDLSLRQEFFESLR